MNREKEIISFNNFSSNNEKVVKDLVKFDSSQNQYSYPIQILNHSKNYETNNNRRTYFYHWSKFYT